ncbi:tRNA(Ile)-lysidine synthase [Paraliobacillus quinghaiensis]|uniref:tRNA(Ile)-lysidine synthase n=1 Tax=Paraliobacillus quinghaiensis TaxID=470815 RepID=A0A917WWS9_9BACI|nr:tRNA lysidine(34) synthetase TilS [Paraliobacillus quinghaiensis]GGM36446.1 tRNA(Ile)-lysidine synthase [Paraliobacillus quinghaiensis]
MEYEIDGFIKRHDLLKPHSTLLIGVSGGPDSMALLYYLNARKHQWDFHLIVLSVDHGLRGEASREDVEYVRAFCFEHNIAFHNTSVDVPTYKKKHKLGTQEAARKMRYTFFYEQMKQHQADYLVLGHHGDDQIETMLMRLTRSSNPAALTGIPLRREFATGQIIRPFLAVTKKDIESYCKEKGITPRRDPSNEEDLYTRNFFRMHLSPLLKEQNPNLHRSIQKLSEAITADTHYLDQQAQKAFESIVHIINKPKQVECSIILLKKYPFALQRRVFHLILNYLYDVLPDSLHYGHEEQFFDLIHSERANASIDLPKKMRMTKSYQSIHFQFQEEKAHNFSYFLPVPGEVRLPDGTEIVASVIKPPFSKNQDRNVLIVQVDVEKQTPFLVRYRQPGDRMYVKGLHGRKKVKDIFIDKKIPLHQRDRWPLIVDQQGDVLWVIGLVKGTEKGHSNGHQFIKIEYRSNENI